MPVRRPPTACWRRCLAERGFDSSQEIIEGKNGFARVYSDVAAPEELNAHLDEGWLIETNGHKPYACGVVLHPLIDAVIAIRNRDRIDPATVSRISLRVHPFVLSITDVVDPATGLQSKFSTLHSAAVALVDGDGRHRAVFRRQGARSAGGGAARQRWSADGDETLGKDEAYAAIVVGNTRHEIHIPHATGTAANPMSDAAIEAKFLANATPVIGLDRAERARDLVWSLDKQPDMRELIGLLA